MKCHILNTKYKTLDPDQLFEVSMNKAIRNIIREEIKQLINDEALFNPGSVAITGTGTIDTEEESEDHDESDYEGGKNIDKHPMKQIKIDNSKYDSDHEYKDDLYMAKSQLYNLHNQSKILFDLICDADPDSIEPWMRSKFAKAFEAIDDVFDNLNYRSGNNKL